jgi:Mg-chelatase subunit ChlD
MTRLGAFGRIGRGIGLAALGLAFAAVSADCGPPRDAAHSFEEKTCGSLSTARSPSPPPKPLTARITGHAERVDDDTVTITLAPLVNVSADAVVDWTASQVTVRGNASAATDVQCDLRLVSEADAPAAVDIVFVLDTTGSMFWAIDGVKKGIRAFLDLLQGFDVDAQVGGIEFGDEVRTSTPPGDIDQFRDWLSHMTAVGGGDGPENPLDAIQAASGFAYRPNALRYLVVITDTGMHERTDDTMCSDTTLAATQASFPESAFLAVVRPNVGAPIGVDPRELTRAVGGLYVAIGSSTTANFDISADTPTDDVLGGIAVLTCTGVADSDAVEVETTVDDEPVTTTLAIDG